MKKIIRGILIPVIISMIFGFISAKVVYSLYNDDIELKLKSSKLYLISNGKYVTYDNMREENYGNNFVYYRDSDGYKSIVGITRDEENIDKIKSLYSSDMTVEEYYIATDLLSDKQSEYDLMLSNTEDILEVKEVVDNILNLYRENDTIKLISIK